MDDFSAALEHEFPEPDLAAPDPERADLFHPRQVAKDLADLSQQTPESKAIDKLAQSYGGGEAVLELLLHADATSPGSPVERVAALMLDPANSGKSLGLMCRLAGVSFAAVMRAINQGHGARAIRASMESFYTVAEAVSQDVGKGALPKQVKCPRCSGIGTIGKGKATKACPECDGARTIEQEGNFEKQKLVLEIAGVHKKHKQSGPSFKVQMNQQQNLRVRSDALSMVDAVKSAASRMLYGQGGTGPATQPTITVQARPVAAAPEPAPAPAPKRPAMLRPAGKRPGS